MKTVNELLLSNSLLNNTMPLINTLLVGDNASAKTYILEETIENNRVNKKCYYISVKNRNVTLDSKVPDKVTPYSSRIINNLLDKRLDNITGNQDLWVDNSLAINIFSALFILGNYCNVINDFFGCDVRIERSRSELNQVIYAVDINGVKHVKLSNGISSIIRILIEIDMARELGCEVVFIDEIEKYLDSNNSYNLIRFIQSRYRDLQFVITTHSDDVIVGSSDFNIIKIINDNDYVKDKGIEVYNSNDYDSNNLVKRKFFQIHENLEYADMFKNVSDIYSELFDNDHISRDDLEYLNHISNNKKIPLKIKNIINGIENLRMALL